MEKNRSMRSVLYCLERGKSDALAAAAAAAAATFPAGTQVMNTVESPLNFT